MAIDNAAYIADMNVNVPENADPIAEGAEQIQAVKRAVKNTFPNLNGAVTATADQINVAATQSNFIGEIKMYFGKLTDLPVGWNLCDGGIYNAVQTPDLRDTFPRAYNPDNDATAPIGTKGGSDEIDLSGLKTVGHPLSASEIPLHKHEFTGDDKLEWGTSGYFHVVKTDVWDVTAQHGDGNHSPKVLTNKLYDNSNREISGGKEHSHGLTGTLDNRPRFTILAFIMYTG